MFFFWPSQAVLSTILRDEYSTSVVKTKEVDKAGSNQLPARDLVHLELMPNYLIFFLENTGSRSTRYVSITVLSEGAQSFQNFSRKAILKLQDQLSQHDRFKILH